jgi:hypothetical protein
MDVPDDFVDLLGVVLLRGPLAAEDVADLLILVVADADEARVNLAWSSSRRRSASCSMTDQSAKVDFSVVANRRR